MNNKRFFAVAGYPVSHSKSPLIFNTLFTSMDIQAHYSRISAKSADEAGSIFKRLGLTGMNITAPLKSSILGLTEEIIEPSGIIGCVNTVINENGTIKGYNTTDCGTCSNYGNITCWVY